MEKTKEQEIQYKSFDLKEPTINAEERTFEAFITATTLDLDGEVVLAKGLDVSRFKEGKGKILYGHDKNFIVGIATEIKRVGERWKIKARFASEQASERINEIYHLVKEGIITTMSIGFSVPTDGRRQPSREDIKMFGRGVRSIITRSKLWEASFVTFESNEEAKVIRVKSLGIDPSLYFKDYEEEVIEAVEEVIEEEVVKEIEEQDKLVAKIKEQLKIEYKNKEVVRIIKEELLKNNLIKKGEIYW